MHKQAKKFRLPTATRDRQILDFYETCDTPRALACALLFKYGEHEQLVRKTVHPDQYNDPEAFFHDFVAVSFLSKYGELDTGIDTAAQALVTFAEGEERCKTTNERLRRFQFGRHEPDSIIRSVLTRASTIVERILGDFSIDEHLELCRWGPGVTLTVKGKDVSWARKFDLERQTTSGHYDLFGDVYRLAYPGWFGDMQPEMVRACRITTVPKNAKTDRTIAIEPGLNVWTQLGIGGQIRSRLRKFGYNLNDASRNQHLARKGSRLGGDVATLDFKAASDSISIEAVRLLLPARWFIILNAARTHCYEFPDSKVPCPSHKFSTMGNGFTWDLESLIFLSVALATCSVLEIPTRNVAVFGDDVTLPCSAVHLYRQVTAFLGFELNLDKSFSEGPFRESCGEYYYDGINVKPFFYKKGVKYVKDVFRLANGISSLASRGSPGDPRSLRYHSLWIRVIHSLPVSLRVFGPLETGDGAIHASEDECATFDRRPSLAARRKWKRWYEGQCFSVLADEPVYVEHKEKGCLTANLFYLTKRMAPTSPCYKIFDDDTRYTVAESMSGGLGELFALRRTTRLRIKTLTVAQPQFAGTWV